VGYITRPDNKSAKAGNVNHALTLTDGEFVVIFDADFVPQRQFLMRAMGFFEDPKVGIVQTPHAFYNHDPMQTNLGMRKSLPDDQRFFFEGIMPSRDGWDAAFCCGSNSITRRTALVAVGGGLPDGSITEDMLLSLVLLRKGFVTRYLSERLAYGLAPESVSAFFVQRQRWARGAIQILFLKSGPLGPGLKLAQRLLFLPTHWLTQGMMCLMCLVVPIIFLLTGVAPMIHTSIEAVFFYLAPMLLAMCGGLVAFAPGKYNPLAAQVLGTFQSFKLLPTVIATFWRPHGHAFKVTPKGAEATGEYERGIFLACVALVFLTLIGLAINLSPEWRIIDDVALVPMVALWCLFNLIVLFLVSLLCLQAPVRRAEERFSVEEPVIVRNLRTGATATLVSSDMSLSGVGLRRSSDGTDDVRAGDPVSVYLSSVGWTPGKLARVSTLMLGVQFEHDGLVERDLLIRKLFTSGQNTLADTATTWSVTIGLLKRIWTAQTQVPAALPPLPDEAPDALPRLPAASLLRAPAQRERPLEVALERLRDAA
jgi:cellulose synthase (UDP-forming)